MKPVFSLSIAARAVLNLHSLNNEGGEGNQIQTRMVNVFADGRLHSVNAISGDMFKHIQSEHLHRLAVQAGLPLSIGARLFNANRINYDLDIDKEFLNQLKGAKSNAAELDLILQRCAVTDMAGALITAENRSLPRKSVVEFGWVVGVPGSVKTDSYFHVKFESERGGGSAGVDESGSITGKQTPFHRPASSGVYAIVVQVEAARVGFNDISQRYAIDAEQRQKRLRALLESVLYTFIEPAGAMRTAQNPHILDVSGVISVSSNVLPAPCISPLKDDFVADVQRVASSLNELHPGAIELFSFASLGEFAEQMSRLIQEAEPFTLPVVQGE
ncbi:DevR family CRISPR-associated autoregulator [Chloroflexus sp. MS-CIW-1]|uniref:DevR family CRISPR-associated autoregulator n=1 Tax=Chloroflexus sp. MS-CIW-1 TaxID=3055768 RepID=UPI00264A37C4|nr:DevR family CRISPR-associated autoregulator [Chloroflexus sp. MS-CIW-1]MDN5272133.1 DevR family CRISPR-associated autoregulator [Chloroflexus sp. MS-CIW-1]